MQHDRDVRRAARGNSSSSSCAVRLERVEHGDAASSACADSWRAVKLSDVVSVQAIGPLIIASAIDALVVELGPARRGRAAPRSPPRGCPRPRTASAPVARRWPTATARVEVERERAERRQRRPAGGRRGSWSSPISPRAQRIACALASVGITAHDALELVGDRRATCPRSPSRPPAAASAARRSSSSSIVSSPSQQGPKTAPTRPRRRAAADAPPAASMTASQSGLARPGSEPSPSTSPPTSTRSRAGRRRARARALARPSATARGPAEDVDEHRRRSPR